MSKKIIVYCFVIFLCVPIHLLVGMDLQCNKPMIDIKLVDDDNKIYSIARWKVIQESNLLCKSYGEQNQAAIINIPGINEQEISLFDKALNTTITKAFEKMSFSDYFKKLSSEEQRILIIAAGKRSADGIKKLNAQRLSCQLINECIDPAIIKKNIILKHSFEYKKVFDYLLVSMIAENIHNDCVKIENACLFDPVLAKELPGGIFKFMLQIVQLTKDSFHGKPDCSLFECEGLRYVLKAHVKTADNGVLALTTAKVENNTYLKNTMCLWQMNPHKLLKTIQHDVEINSALLSSNGKWFISCSNKNQNEKGKLLLTCLDPLSDDYLIDKDLLESENPINPYVTACFDHTSTLLARGFGSNIKLFDLTTRECVGQCFVRSGMCSYVMDLCFNKGGDRLITYTNYGGYWTNRYDHIVTLWDIANLRDIKEIKQITLNGIGRYAPGNPIIAFSDAHSNVLAISLYDQTFFFDLSSGEWYSRCYEQDYSHDVTALIPLSTMACIGMNAKDGTSCVKVYNFSKAYEQDLYGNTKQKKFASYIGMLSYNNKNINGLGVTTDLKYLVATFDNNLVSKAALYSDEDYAAYKEITHNIKLADIYLLFHLYKAKKQGLRAELQNNEYEYIRDHVTTSAKGKALIQKHFLS